MQDVLEIDGASNRGIEQIRELRENAKYAPTSSRYRIFIIDEAHQITKDAFGALLKTLEEPPAHVVFMMATTEVQKIPALLDEVHALYEEKKLHFALSGSSARKLKRGGANLLAGRALQHLHADAERPGDGIHRVDGADAGGDGVSGGGE